MRRRNITNRLEKKNKVPERLAPQKIKDMLDELSMVKPVIGNERQSEIKLNSNRGGILKSLAIAAVFVLAIGGLAVFKFGGEKAVKTHPKTPTPQVADTEGLTGLRGGSYRSLYNFLSDSEDEEYQYSPIDDMYAYMPDGNMSEGDDSVAEMFRSVFENYNVCAAADTDNVFDPSQKIVCGTETIQDQESVLIQQNGASAFAASYTDIYAYKMQGEQTARVDYDFWSQTFLMNTLADDPIFEEKKHTFKAYIVNTCLFDNKLAVAFDFHLPEEYNDIILMNEYCGFCIYDVSDIDNISLVYEYEQPGYLASLKLTEQGKLIMLSQLDEADKATEYCRYSEGYPDFLPSTYENGEEVPISEDKIYIANKSEQGVLCMVSAFDCSDSAEKTGSLTVTASVNNGYALTDSELILAEYYVDEDINGNYVEQKDTTHVMKITFDGEVRISAASYLSRSQENTQSNIISILSDFEAVNGYYYLVGDSSKVLILDRDLKYVSSYLYDIDKLPSDFYDPAYISTNTLISGTKAYTYDLISRDNGFIVEKCVLITDLADPKDPKETYINDPKDAPVIYTADKTSLGGKAAAGVDSIYNAEDKSTTMQLAVYSTDPSDSKVITYKGIDFDETGTSIAGKEFKCKELGEINRTDVAEFKEVDNVTEYFDTQCYADVQNNMIYIPVYKTEREIEEISANETLSADPESLIEYTDESNKIKYKKLIGSSYQVSVIAIRYDPKTLETELLGRSSALKGYNALGDESNPRYTGTLFLNGKLYTFTDAGMSCSSIKDLSKVLYSDTF